MAVHVDSLVDLVALAVVVAGAVIQVNAGALVEDLAVGTAAARCADCLDTRKVAVLARPLTLLAHQPLHSLGAALRHCQSRAHQSKVSALVHKWV